jgi:ferric-dicitrate binding protein FerR (iron transport regulator)
MQWFKWIAAASVLLLLASAGYFIVRSPGSVQPEQAQQKQRLLHDVLPGRQGAVLTLANGRTIILDSATNGTLVSEEGVAIIKKEGKIVYDAHKAPEKIAWNTMTTPPGRQYQLTLADGTSVWLNAASSITYPTAFTGRQRMVKVTGEVYFEVAHNKQMPFVAEKGDVKVEVLGTHFNMNTYDDESALKVTLLQGAVRVTGGGGEHTIAPGQQAVVTGNNITVTNNINREEVMAWKNGRFIFSGTDIHQLMRQVSRWYDVQVQYDKEINDLFYAEIPRNTKLSDVLKALELTGKVHFDMEGKKIIVKP